MKNKTLAYYNENDPSAAAWIRELIKNGLITDGVVDERSISEVQPEDVSGFQRCHFFAGIAGWDIALNLAGWGSQSVWTGSCPCQPFSAAGKRKGTDDERHLWPEFLRLIKACGPQVVFGEQVASSDVVGTELEAAFVDAVQRGDYAAANRAANKLCKQSSLSAEHRWLDGIFTDLEEVGYTCWPSDLPAACVGAPHIRQRIFWVGDASYSRLEGRRLLASGRSGERSACTTGVGHWSDFDIVPCGDGKTRRLKPGLEPLVNGLHGRASLLRGYGNAIVPQVAAEFIRAYLDC